MIFDRVIMFTIDLYQNLYILLLRGKAMEIVN